MKYPAPTFYLAAILLVATATIATMAFANDGEQSLADVRQATQMRTIFMLSPYLRDNNLTVTVQDARAVIHGAVGDVVSKALTTQIAFSVDGIEHVDNQIKIIDNYRPPAPSSQSAYGEFIDDASITSAVKSKFLWNQQTVGLAVGVITQRGCVTLTGTADSRKKRESAGWLARNTRGVTLVRNNIVVNDIVVNNIVDHETLRDDVATAEQVLPEMPDSWITAKVLATFRYSTNTSNANISVTTGSGVVTLVGKVEGAVELIRAIELARNVIGVTGVISRDLVY